MRIYDTCPDCGEGKSKVSARCRRCSYKVGWRGNCITPGCDQPHYGLGLCRLHYRRRSVCACGASKNTRSIHCFGCRVRGTIPICDRLWTKVDFDGPIPIARADLGACWLWKTLRSPSSYASVGIGRRRQGAIPAHRMTYQLLRGAIPDGLVLDHLCRTPPCVNPWHLEPVTLRENFRRGEHNGGRAQKMRTHCPKGHPYDEANTYHYKGHRSCIACKKMLRSHR